MGFLSVGYMHSGLFAAARAIKNTYTELLASRGTRGLRGQIMDFEEFTRS